MNKSGDPMLLPWREVAGNHPEATHDSRGQFFPAALYQNSIQQHRGASREHGAIAACRLLLSEPNVSIQFADTTVLYSSFDRSRNVRYALRPLGCNAHNSSPANRHKIFLNYESETAEQPTPYVLFSPPEEQGNQLNQSFYHTPFGLPDLSCTTTFILFGSSSMPSRVASVFRQIGFTFIPQPPTRERLHQLSAQSARTATAPNHQWPNEQFTGYLNLLRLVDTSWL